MFTLCCPLDHIDACYQVLWTYMLLSFPTGKAKVKPAYFLGNKPHYSGSQTITHGLYLPAAKGKSYTDGFEEKNMYHNRDLTLGVPCLTVALNKKVTKMTTLQSPFFRRIWCDVMASMQKPHAWYLVKQLLRSDVKNGKLSFIQHGCLNAGYQSISFK